MSRPNDEVYEEEGRVHAAERPDEQGVSNQPGDEDDEDEFDEEDDEASADDEEDTDTE